MNLINSPIYLAPILAGVIQQVVHVPGQIIKNARQYVQLLSIEPVMLQDILTMGQGDTGIMIGVLDTDQQRKKQ